MLLRRKQRKQHRRSSQRKAKSNLTRISCQARRTKSPKRGFLALKDLKKILLKRNSNRLMIKQIMTSKRLRSIPRN